MTDHPLHWQPRALGLVALGGFVGAPARYLTSKVFPTPAHGWPTGTFLVNVVGAFVLGALLEGLARSGPDTGLRRQLRLLIGTGFCGALTTYSTLAVEVDLLANRGRPAPAAFYCLASVAAGLVAAALGITLAAGGRPPEHLPVDPDAEI